MIRKIFTHLFKPTEQLKLALHKYSFSSSSKQEKTQPQNNQSKKNQDNEKSNYNDQQSQKTNRNQQENQKDEQFVYQQQDRNTVGWWIYRTFFWGTTFTLGYNIYLVAYHDKKSPVEDQPTAVPGMISVAKMIHNQYHESLKFFIEPPVKKFLPDPIHPLMQPKTLVLNLSGTILKTDFIFGKGITLQKRPGLTQFLKKLQHKYEIIIFTNDDYMLLTSAVASIDPRSQIFMGAFGNQCMIWHKGHYIKDLAYLNRDLKNIVVIDKDIKNVGKHPQNAIIIKQYTGGEDDTQLLKLIPLLEGLSDQSVPDIRKTLAKLGDKPVQTYYQRFQQKKKKIQKKSSGFFGLFGGGPSKN